MKQTTVGIALYAVLIIPPVARLMESIMVVHMLIQLPLLILVGWLLGKWFIAKFPRFFFEWNASGVPGIIVVIFITTYWMFPRTLDESLSLWYIELFKFISLPLVGLCIRDSWQKLQIIGKSFIFLNYLPMFGLMAWLYIDSPIQICNNYLEVEQKALGWGFLLITVCMILYLLQQVFTDHSEQA